MKIDPKDIAAAIQQKGATVPCHRCHKNQFTVIEGFSNIALQDNFNAGLILGGPSVPVALIACTNCGAITHHALGALGLLPGKKD